MAQYHYKAHPGWKKCNEGGHTHCHICRVSIQMERWEFDSIYNYASEPRCSSCQEMASKLRGLMEKRR